MEKSNISSFQALLAFIYLASGISFYYQYQGLYGPNGITPLQCPHQHQYRHQQQSGFKDIISSFLAYPSLICLHEYFQINTYGMAELVMFMLILTASVTLILGPYVHIANFSFYSIAFFIMWICYLSIITVGGTFTSFQWDILLLEVGFLSIITGGGGRCRRIVVGRSRDDGHRTPGDAPQ